MAADFLRRHGIDLQYEMSKVQFGDALDVGGSSPAHSALPAIHTLTGVRLPTEAHNLVDINIAAGTISSLVPHNASTGKLLYPSGTINARGRVLAPSLCHPHIHLDKCFLLSDPKYSDLRVLTGDFQEALALSAEAKSRFEDDDLLRRGRWLVTESIAAGVTCMRAFVEVDTTVKFKCLDACLRLKKEYRDSCNIQICVFAQEPILSKGNNNSGGATLIEEALGREAVDVLGSTPYVEDNAVLARANIDWAMSTALRYGKHLDLHLDYNLDPEQASVVEYVIKAAEAQDWKTNAKDKTIVLSHCTRLTLFNPEEWRYLRTRIGDLPIFFVGLPTSDLYMMGRPDEKEGGGQRVRGTLQIPEMIRKYFLNGSIGINNVGNAFTPQGGCDPMALASMGVGLYQAGTKEDTELLYVSNPTYLASRSLRIHHT